MGGKYRATLLRDGWPQPVGEVETPPQLGFFSAISSAYSCIPGHRPYFGFAIKSTVHSSQSPQCCIRSPTRSVRKSPLAWVSARMGFSSSGHPSSVISISSVITSDFKVRSFPEPSVDLQQPPPPYPTFELMISSSRLRIRPNHQRRSIDFLYQSALVPYDETSTDAQPNNSISPDLRLTAKARAVILFPIHTVLLNTLQLFPGHFVRLREEINLRG